MPSNEIFKLLAGTLCKNHDTEPFCANVLFLICGFDKKELNAVSPKQMDAAIATNSGSLFIIILVLFTFIYPCFFSKVLRTNIFIILRERELSSVDSVMKFACLMTAKSRLKHVCVQFNL